MPAASPWQLGEVQCRHILDTAYVGISFLDTQFELQYVNRRLGEMLGYSPAEIVGRSLLEFVHEADRAMVQERLEHHRHGTREQYEFRMMRKDRSVLWVLACCNTILGEHGEFLGALGMVTDITGRKQGEAALLEDQDRLRCFFDAAHAAIVIHDNGCILDANQALADMFGYGLNEMIGRHTTDFAAPEARELVRAQSLSGDLQPYEVIGQRKDGSTFPIEVHGRNIHYHGRNVRVATLLDITDRNRADEVARKLASIVESSDDAIFSTTPAGIIVSWNRGAERAHGFSATEIQGQALDILLPVERRSEAAQFLDRVRRGERIDYFETTWLRNDGQPVQVGLTVSPLKDSRGQVTGALVVGRDLAARKRAEDTLHGSQRLLRDVMEGSTDAFYIKDQQGRYVTINSAGARMLGKTVEDVIGKDDMELFSEETAHEIMERDLQVLVSGETRSYEERGTAAGKTRIFFTTKGPYRNSKGAVVGLIGISRDITERKHLEEQLRQAQKMEAVGRLAGGVAHDFNNLLTAITSYADMLVEAIPPVDPLHHHAKEIIRAADRAASLTRQLLAYSRQQVLTPQVLNLNTSVANMERMLRRLIGEDIELITALDPALRPVRADPGQVEQVLMNLAVNARDAMPQGGRLTISTANIELDETYAWLHVDVQPGAYVRLSVTDTGCGMTEEVRTHLFEPFFTTKDVGKGTGLGLSTVYGIIKQSEGHVDVVSEPGQGTSFHVYLPQVMETTRTDPRVAHAAHLLRGAETVLLVEDEDVVRALTRTVLQRSGYTIVEASHGIEALRLCEQFEGQIDLLLTDVVMPHMNGRQLYLHLSQLRPGVKVLYMSGYTGGAIAHLGELEAEAAFLQKPFAPDVLVRKVREVLDG